MLEAVKHGVANLTNFRGRDARQAFWYYALAVYLATMAVGMLTSVPMVLEATIAGMTQTMANAGNQDQAATEAAIQAATAQSMQKYAPVLLWSGVISAAITLFGLAASIVRRLHDSGLSGFWGLIPLALKCASLVTLPLKVDPMEAVLQAQAHDPFAMFKAMDGIQGVVAAGSWIATIIVVALCVRKSTDGPNQYGEAPFIA